MNYQPEFWEDYRARIAVLAGNRPCPAWIDPAYWEAAGPALWRAASLSAPGVMDAPFGLFFPLQRIAQRAWIDELARAWRLIRRAESLTDTEWQAQRDMADYSLGRKFHRVYPFPEILIESGDSGLDP